MEKTGTESGWALRHGCSEGSSSQRLSCESDASSSRQQRPQYSVANSSSVRGVVRKKNISEAVGLEVRSNANILLVISIALLSMAERDISYMKSAIASGFPWNDGSSVPFSWKKAFIDGMLMPFSTEAISRNTQPNDQTSEDELREFPSATSGAQYLCVLTVRPEVMLSTSPE